MKSVLLISVYFGKWPFWIEAFLLSCRRNPSINWLIYTDCETPDTTPPNVRIVEITKEDYYRHVRAVLGVNFSPNDPYNLVNLRPMFGKIYQKEIQGFDYFGWSDLDVIFGDIRAFYNEQVLEHNVISSSNAICTGHLLLIKNEAWLRDAYQLIPNWRERLEDPRPCPWEECLDEAKLSAIFSPMESLRQRLAGNSSLAQVPSKYWTNNYFREQYTTVFVPYPWHDGSPEHPDVWHWHDGKLYNERDGDREFLYLHMMNFRYKRYVNESLYGSAPTWDQREAMPRVKFEPDYRGTITISREGIQRSSLPVSPGQGKRGWRKIFGRQTG